MREPTKDQIQRIENVANSINWQTPLPPVVKVPFMAELNPVVKLTDPVPQYIAIPNAVLELRRYTDGTVRYVFVRAEGWSDK